MLVHGKRVQLPNPCMFGSKIKKQNSEQDQVNMWIHDKQQKGKEVVGGEGGPRSFPSSVDTMAR